LKITERVHLVGSGKAGFNLTDPLDCHVWLIDGGDEYALIDAGAGVAPEEIVARIEEDGLDPGRVRHLLLTHAHADHSGGAAALRERLGLTVAGSAETAAWVSAGDEEKISLDAARRAGVYPPGYRFTACPVDTVLGDGDRYRVGDLDLTAIATPGHSAGMLSYLFDENGRRSAFTGDTIFAGGRILLQDIWDCSVQESCRSIERLFELELHGLYPGHQAFAVQRGHEHVAAAMAKIAQLLPPDQMA
jgi:glyoxylase-like metal-dependent hydrolase (beta-lactamase superfamily II)